MDSVCSTCGQKENMLCTLLTVEKVRREEEEKEARRKKEANEARREEEEKEARNKAISELMLTIKHNSIVRVSKCGVEISKLAAEFGYNVNFLFSKLKPNAKEFFPQTSLS